MSRPIKRNKPDKELLNDKITPPESSICLEAIESLFILVKKLPIYGVLYLLLIILMCSTGMIWQSLSLMGILWVLCFYTVLKEVKPIIRYLLQSKMWVA